MELAGLEPATLLGAMTRSRCSLGQIQLVQALSAHVTSERSVYFLQGFLETERAGKCLSVKEPQSRIQRAAHAACAYLDGPTVRPTA